MRKPSNSNTDTSIIDEQLIDADLADTLPAPWRFSRDQVRQAGDMEQQELRALVKLYYSLQENRKKARNQESAHQRQATVLRDSVFVAQVKDWLSDLEGQIKRVLEQHVKSSLLGRWMLSHVGVGPVVAAGLLGHLELDPWVCRAPDDVEDRCRPHDHDDHRRMRFGCGRKVLHYVGHWHNFAGLNPTLVWEKGQKRPYNQELKVLCWKLGTSFVRSLYVNTKKEEGQKNDYRAGAFYGHLYLKRKAEEVARNDSGALAEQAHARLARAKAEGWAISPEQRKTWSEGRIQASGLDLRAKRWVTKLFLSHLHHVWYDIRFGNPPPPPYVIERLGHHDYVPPPNWPLNKE